jgi:hypothetical protein
VDDREEVATSDETAKTLCQTVTTLTKTTKNAVAALLSRTEIELVMSFILLPHRRFPPRVGLAAQSFNS